MVRATIISQKAFLSNFASELMLYLYCTGYASTTCQDYLYFTDLYFNMHFLADVSASILFSSLNRKNN